MATGPPKTIARKSPAGARRENTNPRQFETLLAELSVKFISLRSGEIDHPIEDVQRPVLAGKTRRNWVRLGMLLLTLAALGASAATPKRVLILDSFGRDVAPFSIGVSAR